MQARFPSSPRYEIEGLIRRQSINLLVGDSHLGKSPLAIQLALCKAAGVPFLGHATSPAGRTLHLDFENDGEDFWDIAETISKHLGLNNVPDNFRGWSPYWDDRGRTDDSEVFTQQIEDRIRAVKPNLAIIDPLRVPFPYAVEKQSLTADFITQQKRLIKQTGCSILVIHHLRKQDRHAHAVKTTLVESGPQWFQNVCGMLALINHMGGRFGIEAPGSGSADLVLGGFMRSTPSLAPHFIERVHDAAANPLGYRLLPGIELLPEQWRRVYDELPAEFRYGSARTKLGNDDATTKFLTAVQAAGRLDKLDGRRGYRKAGQDRQSEQSTPITSDESVVCGSD